MGEPGGRTARVCPGVRQSTPELPQVQRDKLSSRPRIADQVRDSGREDSGAHCAAGAHFFTSTSNFTPSLRLGIEHQCILERIGVPIGPFIHEFRDRNTTAIESI